VQVVFVHTEDNNDSQSHEVPTPNPKPPMSQPEYATGQTIRVVLVDEDIHQRLDVVLCRHLKLTRSQTRQLLEQCQVLLNGAPADLKAKGHLLQWEDCVEITHFTPPHEQQPIAQPELPLNIVNEGLGWVIVNKPAGMPVHPLRPDETNTVLNALIARYPRVQGVGESGLKSGVVHRLDVDTSGTLAFALHPNAWQLLRHAFQKHRIQKTYRAIVKGELSRPGNHELIMRLAVTQHRPAQVNVIETQPATLTDAHRQPSADARHGTGAGRWCKLTWRTLHATPRASLLEIDLHSGFLHQIRVMFAHLGHPVLGDNRYGNVPINHALQIPHLMLHAHTLALDNIYGSAEPPATFNDCWQKIIQ